MRKIYFVLALALFSRICFSQITIMDSLINPNGDVNSWIKNNRNSIQINNDNKSPLIDSLVYTSCSNVCIISKIITGSVSYLIDFGDGYKTTARINQCHNY